MIDDVNKNEYQYTYYSIIVSSYVSFQTYPYIEIDAIVINFFLMLLRSLNME
jgi:hypothetical protein